MIDGLDGIYCHLKLEFLICFLIELFGDTWIDDTLFLKIIAMLTKPKLLYYQTYFQTFNIESFYKRARAVFQYFQLLLCRQHIGT